MVRGWQKGTDWRAHASPIYSWELGSGGCYVRASGEGRPAPDPSEIVGRDSSTLNCLAAHISTPPPALTHVESSTHSPEHTLTHPHALFSFSSSTSPPARISHNSHILARTRTQTHASHTSYASYTSYESYASHTSHSYGPIEPHARRRAGHGRCRRRWAAAGTLVYSHTDPHTLLHTYAHIHAHIHKHTPFPCGILGFYSVGLSRKLGDTPAVLSRRKARARRAASGLSGRCRHDGDKAAERRCNLGILASGSCTHVSVNTTSLSTSGSQNQASNIRHLMPRRHSAPSAPSSHGRLWNFPIRPRRSLPHGLSHVAVARLLHNRRRVFAPTSPYRNRRPLIPPSLAC